MGGVVTEVTRSTFCKSWVITINHDHQYAIDNISARDVLSLKNKKVTLTYDENHKSCFYNKIITINE